MAENGAEVVLMRGAYQRRVADDAGMTIVELIFAASILFIILTGVLGLIGQTTLMTADAAQSNVMTSAVNAYVERVQGLDFEQVAISGETSDGVLLSVETTNVNGYTVEFVPYIVNVLAIPEDPNSKILWKNLYLDVTLTRADGDVEAMSTMVVIRDRSEFLTRAERNPATDPTIGFIGGTPPDGTVVYDANWMDGATQRALYLSARADAVAGRTIDSVWIDIDGLWLSADYLGNRAQWYPQTQSWSVSSFIWYTRQKEDVVQADGSVVQTEAIPDGMRRVTVYAEDSTGVRVSATRSLLVDNRIPGNAGTPAPVMPGKATSIGITWPPAMDGTSEAHHYGIWALRMKTTAEVTADPSSYWLPITLTGNTAVPSAGYTMTTQPFTRYLAYVRAYSPRNLASAANVWVAEGFTTRPLLTGTYTITGNKVGSTWYYKTAVNLSVTPPNMHVWGTPTYLWHWRYSTGHEGQQYSSVPTLTLSTSERPSVPYQLEWWVDVYYTPAGTTWGNGVQKMVTSNRLPFNGIAVGTFTFDEGTW